MGGTRNLPVLLLLVVVGAPAASAAHLLQSAQECKIAEQEQSTFRGRCAERESAQDETVDLIVRFNEYRPQEEQEELLSASLCGIASDTDLSTELQWCRKAGVLRGASWAWIPRENAAKAFPTDFGLVRVASSLVESFKAVLGAVKLVKDVHLDRKFTLEQFLGPKYYQEVMADMANSKVCPVEESATHGKTLARRRLLWQLEDESDDSDLANKPPGRRLTRWSFDESDEEELKELEDQQRRQHELRQSRWGASAGDRELLSSDNLRTLLASEKQVTSAVNAKALWDQGFSGVGIKTGVFDTGVREVK